MTGGSYHNARWGAPKRTVADREADCTRFCATARVEAVRAIADDELAARYGVSLQFAKYRRALRLQREPVA